MIHLPTPLAGGGFVVRGQWVRAIALALIAQAVFLFALISPRAADFSALSVVTASGPHAFQVEVAADEASREKGLMNRRYMPTDRGMLFEFDHEGPVAFWMKNTYIPLDMIFIGRNGVVTHIVANAEPLSEAVIPSGGPCVAVLEVNGGVAAQIGLKAGDRVRHPFFKP